MTQIGGGHIGSTNGANSSITLSTTDGTTGFTVFDADGFIIFRVKSNGVVETRQRIQRVVQ